MISSLLGRRVKVKFASIGKFPPPLRVKPIPNATELAPIRSASWREECLSTPKKSEIKIKYKNLIRKDPSQDKQEQITVIRGRKTFRDNSMAAVKISIAAF